MGPILTDTDAAEQVTVPDIPNFLNSCQLSLLQTIIDPLQQCDDYGKSIYIATRQLVRQMI